jgi:hypothetical protein
VQTLPDTNDIEAPFQYLKPLLFEARRARRCFSQYHLLASQTGLMQCAHRIGPGVKDVVTGEKIQLPLMAASAGSRMVCEVRLSQLRLRYMGVKLSSGNVFVSEKRLHYSQVGTVLQHVCRATVAKHVRTGLAL